jgi:hypothetical protein
MKLEKWLQGVVMHEEFKKSAELRKFLIQKKGTEDSYWHGICNVVVFYKFQENKFVSLALQLPLEKSWPCNWQAKGIQNCA